MPKQLPAILMSAKYVFVREDASFPSLVPLYHSPYLVLERLEKFFRIQLGSRTDVVAVQRLKPVFSDDPVSVAVPLARGRPALKVPDPVLRLTDQLTPPSSTVPVPVRPRKSVCL